MIINFNIRVFLNSFDFSVLNRLSSRLVGLAWEFNLKFIGPVYLPTKRKFFNILRSPHVNKDSRDQLEIFFHKRFIDFIFINDNILSLIKDSYDYYNIDFNFIFL